MNCEYYFTPLNILEIREILDDQTDQMPNIFRCIITLNIYRYIGNSDVCGSIEDESFELKNRKDPFLSLKAHGELFKIKSSKAGTIIKIVWIKPKIKDIFGSLCKRYTYDRLIIIGFLMKFLNIRKIESDALREYLPANGMC